MMSEAVDDVLRRIERIEALSEQIASIRRDFEKLPELEREFLAMRVGLFKTMGGIDVVANGNHGYEMRMTAFLSQLVKAAKGNAQQGGSSEAGCPYDCAR